MWVKLYINLTVKDNSSNLLSNVDLEIAEDNAAVYSTPYFGGSDDLTNSTGEIAPLLVSISKYDGSSTPVSVTTTIKARYFDWVKSNEYDICLLYTSPSPRD